MCPLAYDPLAAMLLNGCIEHVFIYLERHKSGSPLPEGLFEDINPYLHSPLNLPVGILYLVNLIEKKENAFGTWEVKEDATEIFSNSSISGLRTTLQFIEYRDSQERKTTNWVMHEYKIILKKLSPTNKEKEAKVICRVFLLPAWSSNVHDESKVYTNAGRNMINTTVSIFPTNNNYKQGSTSSSVGEKGDGTKKDLDLFPRALSEEHYHMLNGDYMELDDLADPSYLVCDYLELDDLAEPLSRSSSSDDSSLFSTTSEEYFDPNMLLQQLEDNNSNHKQGKDVSSKFSVMSSIKPFEVFVQPATSVIYGGPDRGFGPPRSLVCCTERKIARRDSLTIAASNTNPLTSEGKIKAEIFLKRNKLKHFCFMSFHM